MRGILFDLDGVIIDSEGLYTTFWEETEAEFPTGIPDFARVIKGTNLDKILDHFKDPDVRAEVLRRIHEFDSHLTYPLFPGAMELLAGLHELGVPCALYSSSNPEKMARLFTVHPSLRHAFAAIVNGSMVTRSKPDPEGYVKAAGMIHCSPADCVVVEDSIQGIRAGLAAGAAVAAIAGTNTREALLKETSTVFNAISEITPQILLSLHP